MPSRRHAWTTGPSACFALLFVLAADGLAQDVDELEARGDAAFERRAEGASNGEAAPGPISEAIDAYRQALDLRPEDLGLRVKLLHALFFRGEYVPADNDARRRVFEEGRQLFETGRDQLSSELGVSLRELEPDEAAERLEGVAHADDLIFWGGVHWGLWGEYFGRFAAVRQGVAGKIRALGETARRLDESMHGAGPLRILGRLHAIAPKVPFFTGWIDRRLGVEYLERAVEIAPEDPLNRFFLAEGLLDHAPSRSDEAVEILCRLRGEEPREGFEVEDSQALARARQRLVGLSEEDRDRCNG
jgi:tetratricopeptide (TPR) repeat protein